MCGLQGRIETLRAQIAEEEMCHEEIVAFSQRNDEQLQKKSDEWQVRFENECMTTRQADLDKLKSTRAKDLQTLKELATKYKVCTAVLTNWRRG
jgi:hypothetical protein